MNVTAELEPMSKPKGRPKRSERDDIAVKVDRTLVSRARHIAHYRGVPLAEILSELLRAPLDKAYGQMLREIDKRGDKE